MPAKKTYTVETKSRRLSELGFAYVGGAQYVLRSYAQGYFYCHISYYPSDAIRIICDQTGEVINEHPGNNNVTLA